MSDDLKNLFQELEKAKKESVKEENPCWKGYKQVGMKDKGGRKVPNKFSYTIP